MLSAIDVKVPIHKEEYRSEVKNHKLVSLLCSTSKVFEEIIRDSHYQHGKSRISPKQRGFSERKFVIIQMLEYLYVVYEHFVSPQYNELCVLYLDFQKAFDSAAALFFWKMQPP